MSARIKTNNFFISWTGK